MTRTPLKNLALTALHLLICCAVSAAALFIQTLFMKPTGETVSSFIFSSEIYRINPLMWVLGALLGFAGLTAVLRTLLRQDFCCAAKQKPLLTGIWCAFALLGTLLILAGNVWVLILRLGVMSGISFGRYDWLILSCSVLFPAYVLIMLIIFCISEIRNRKKAQHEAV